MDRRENRWEVDEWMDGQMREKEERDGIEEG